MGVHKTEGQLDIMKRENADILKEENYKQKYDGFDPNSEESYIIFKLQQHGHLTQSLDLARRIEKQFDTHAKRTSRGVKQAGFLVLWKTAMPAVLIETGFLSNEKEEKYLTSVEGQQNLASAIYKAVKEYKQAHRR
jgi:N-acetylmuramoyl-L-alanine amidase